MQTQGRESIAAKLVANLITEAGANRVLACDLHSGQSMGYFDIPVDHVYGQVCQTNNLLEIHMVFLSFLHFWVLCEFLTLLLLALGLCYSLWLSLSPFGGTIAACDS